MTTDEAIQLLENATGQLRLTREEHVRVQIALSTVRNAVTPQSVDISKTATETKKK